MTLVTERIQGRRIHRPAPQNPPTPRQSIHWPHKRRLYTIMTRRIQTMLLPKRTLSSTNATPTLCWVSSFTSGLRMVGCSANTPRNNHPDWRRHRSNNNCRDETTHPSLGSHSHHQPRRRHHHHIGWSSSSSLAVPCQFPAVRTLVTTATNNNDLLVDDNINNGSIPRQQPEEDEEEQYQEVVLFHRPVNSMALLMRSGFLVSTLHTAYWIWYATDFIPTVNAVSAMTTHHPDDTANAVAAAALGELLYIHPLVGVAGVAFAATLNAAAALLPSRLVSKLSYQQTHQHGSSSKIMVYTHRLPFMRPNLLPSASFAAGDDEPRRGSSNSDRLTTGQQQEEQQEQVPLPRQYLKLDPSSAAAVRIVRDYQGDITRHRGYLPIAGMPSRRRYLLLVQSPSDIPQPELLWQALVRPETLTAQTVALMTMDETQRRTSRRKGTKSISSSKHSTTIANNSMVRGQELAANQSNKPLFQSMNRKKKNRTNQRYR